MDVNVTADLQIEDNGVDRTLSAADLAQLPTGAATSAKQDAQTAVLTDGTQVSGMRPDVSATSGTLSTVTNFDVPVSSKGLAHLFINATTFNGTYSFMYSLDNGATFQALYGKLPNQPQAPTAALAGNQGTHQRSLVAAIPPGATHLRCSISTVAAGSLVAKITQSDVAGDPSPSAQVAGTVAVSNIPSASTMSDTMGNPTTSWIAAMSAIYNGSTWERLRGSGGAVYAQKQSDRLAATLSLGALNAAVSTPVLPGDQSALFATGGAGTSAISPEFSFDSTDGTDGTWLPMLVQYTNQMALPSRR